MSSTGPTGQYRARVIGSDTVEDNFFGDAVSVSGGRFFVGAPGNETAGFQAGAFYGFDGGSLRQDFRLEPFRRCSSGRLLTLVSMGSPLMLMRN
jgi:hypothetical protein